MAKKAAKKKTTAAKPGPAKQHWPVFIDVPGHPELVERCDWDPVNNEPSCQIIPRVPAKGTRVRVAGRVAGVAPRHRAKRR